LLLLLLIKRVDIRKVALFVSVHIVNCAACVCQHYCEQKRVDLSRKKNLKKDEGGVKVG
jgi:hypothetical protein